jgi:hypothetical protein
VWLFVPTLLVLPCEVRSASNKQQVHASAKGQHCNPATHQFTCRSIRAARSGAIALQPAHTSLTPRTWLLATTTPPSGTARVRGAWPRPWEELLSVVWIICPESDKATEALHDHGDDSIVRECAHDVLR